MCLIPRPSEDYVSQNMRDAYKEAIRGAVIAQRKVEAMHSNVVMGARRKGWKPDGGPSPFLALRADLEREVLAELESA